MSVTDSYSGNRAARSLDSAVLLFARLAIAPLYLYS